MQKKVMHAPHAAEVAAAAHVRDAKDETSVQQRQAVGGEVHVVADLVCTWT